jgi:hypothetical protein
VIAAEDSAAARTLTPQLLRILVEENIRVALQSAPCMLVQVQPAVLTPAHWQQRKTVWGVGAAANTLLRSGNANRLLFSVFSPGILALPGEPLLGAAKPGKLCIQ